MRVLITNIILAERTGTEVVTIELARGLARRGHEVAVFTPQTGPSAAALRADGITVTNRTEDLPFKPDIIHGHHNLTVAPVLARYPDVPALFVSHDAVLEYDSPLLSPQIVRFFAVDELRRQRVLREVAALTTRVDILPNVVDLDRFRPRVVLPERPRRALLLAKDGKHIPAVRAAANKAGLSLDELGPAVGRVADDLNNRLAAYDLVFTSGRMALETLAVGCAVVLCDGEGHAGLVTGDQVDPWRRDNFGRQIMTQSPTTAALLAEIACYDAADAAAVSARIRGTAALSAHLLRVEDIYRDIVANWTCTSDDLRRHSEALTAFIASWLRQCLPEHRALGLQCAAATARLAEYSDIINSRSGLLRHLLRVTMRKPRRASHQ